MTTSRSVVAGAALVLLVIGVSGCAKKNQLNLEMTREVVVSKPNIREVALDPVGRIDTRLEGRAVNVRVTGDSELQATFDVEGRSRGLKLDEVQPGVYSGSFQVKKGDTGTVWVTAHLLHPPSGAIQDARSAEPLELFESEEAVLDGSGTGPCNATTAAEYGAALKSLTVLFEFNRYDLSSEFHDLLVANKALLESNPDCLVEVNGHADDIGSDEYNLNLSMNRALAVARLLETIGIPARRLSKRWHGESIPAQTGDSPESRAANRRVELHAAAPN